MVETQITFNDGAAYEQMMGKWSRLAGDVFLDWLHPAEKLRWVEVGCGNGAFTELLFERCAPEKVEGIDPSEEQLAFARNRLAGRPAHWHLGGATSLPFHENSFDAAVMALVIFFVPDPPKGVEEMKRVVVPGGLVSAYAWDFTVGGFPLEPIQAELRAIGVNPPRPPQYKVSQMDSFLGLWKDCGLKNIKTTTIRVTRTFEDFDDYWATCLLGPSIDAVISAMPPSAINLLKERLRDRVAPSQTGAITLEAIANAVSGIVPQ